MTNKNKNTNTRKKSQQKKKNKKSQIENLVLACGRIGMQPLPDDTRTRTRTRNRSLRFCFRFRFRIWFAVYQFNAHFGARLGFVFCFLLLLASSSRCVVGASSSNRRLKTELQLKTWLSCSRSRGRRRRIAARCSLFVCASCDAPKAARRAPIVCIPPKATKCQVDAIASPVRSSSFSFVQPRAVFSCSYFVFRSSQFAFCFSYFRWLLFFCANWFYS